MMNGADVQCVRIEASADEVLGFLANPTNLPRWAVGFAADVEVDEAGSAVVVTGGGDRVPVRLECDERVGVVDFVMAPAPGAPVTAWARVVPVEDASLVTFAQAQPSPMPDHVFEGQVAAVTHELAVLRALMEVACPL